jgi:hypothetical protein
MSPIAKPRLSSSTLVAARARIHGQRRAAPTPWTAREPISQPIDNDADQNLAPVPVHVAQPAAGNHEDPEGQGVDVQHPLRGGDVGRKVTLDGRDQKQGAGEVGADRERRYHQGRDYRFCVSVHLSPSR